MELSAVINGTFGGLIFGFGFCGTTVVGWIIMFICFGVDGYEVEYLVLCLPCIRFSVLGEGS